MSRLSTINDLTYNVTITAKLQGGFTPREGVDTLRILQFLELAHSEQALMPQVVESCSEYLKSSCCSHL